MSVTRTNNYSIYYKVVTTEVVGSALSITSTTSFLDNHDSSTEVIKLSAITSMYVDNKTEFKHSLSLLSVFYFVLMLLICDIALIAGSIPLVIMSLAGSIFFACLARRNGTYLIVEATNKRITTPFRESDRSEIDKIINLWVNST
jgi:hypothetical protein